MKLRDSGSLSNQREHNLTAEVAADVSESRSSNGRKTIANKILNRLPSVSKFSNTRSGKNDNGNVIEKKKAASAPSAPDGRRRFRLAGRMQSQPASATFEKNSVAENQLVEKQSRQVVENKNVEHKREQEVTHSIEMLRRQDGSGSNSGSNSNIDGDCDDDELSFVQVVSPPSLSGIGSTMTGDEIITKNYEQGSKTNGMHDIPENDLRGNRNIQSPPILERRESLSNVPLPPPLQKTKNLETSLVASSILEPSNDALKSQLAASLELSTLISSYPKPPQLMRSTVSSTTVGDHSLASIPSVPPPLPLTLQRSISKTYAVKRTVSSLSQYKTTPIEKHYELSRQILDAFESHYTNEVWMTAYRVGLQFVETALLEIPKHGYYRSSRHETQRMQCNLDAARVAQMLNHLLVKASEEPVGAVHDPESLQAAGLVGNIGYVQKLEEIAFNMIEQASSDQECRDPKESSFIKIDDGSGIFQQKQTSRAQKYEPHKIVENDRDDWVVCEAVSNVVGNAVDSIRSCSGGGGGRDSTSKSSDALDRAIVRSPEHSAASSTTSYTQNNRVESDVKRPPLPPLPLPNQRTSSWSSGLVKKNSNYASLRKSSKTSLSDSQSTIIPLPPPLLSISSSFIGDGSVIDGTSVISIHSSDKDDAENLQLEKALFLSGLEVNPIDNFFEKSQFNESAFDFLSKSNHTELVSDRVDSNESVLRAVDASLLSVGSIRINNSQVLLQLQTLATFYYDDFVGLQDEGRVRIKFINTYQGRVPESTNGCAVIAPLICIHHLLNDDSHVSNDFLPDFEIQQVIDCETPSILNSIRQQLRLSDHAFLIPSDVHDYLLAQGQLCQSQFLNVTGGNILDESHLHAFIDLMEKAHDNDTSLRIAATFFFHEHVVAILKVRRRSAGRQTTTPKFCYEFVDSLPFKTMLRREHESDDDMFNRFKIPLQETNIINPDRNGPRDRSNMTSIYESTRAQSNGSDIYSGSEASESSANDMNSNAFPTSLARTTFQTGTENYGSFENYDHLLQQHSDQGSDVSQYLDDDGNTVIIPRTVRIRCFDGESLEALLRWYACSVFTNENMSYINQYSWNDAKCDFDPRVFQAFIWSN